MALGGGIAPWWMYSSSDELLDFAIKAELEGNTNTANWYIELAIRKEQPYEDEIDG